MRDARQLALIGVGQVLDEFRDGDPRDLSDLWILIVHNAVYKTQQVVVHGLMDAHPIRDEPVINHAEVRKNLTRNAGFFPYLAFSGDLLGLAIFHVALGHGPQQASAAVEAADERHIEPRKVDIAIGVDALRQAGDNEAARGGFIAGFHGRGLAIATAVGLALLSGAARAIIRPAAPPAPGPVAVAAASLGGALFLVSHPCQS